MKRLVLQIVVGAITVAVTFFIIMNFAIAVATHPRLAEWVGRTILLLVFVILSYCIGGIMFDAWETKKRRKELKELGYD